MSELCWAEPYPKDRIVLRINRELEYLGNVGYVIEVNQNNIQIEAFHSKGIFWAFQTLLQLLPDDILRDAKVYKLNWHIQNCYIEDSPRFLWRGLMIDYIRTFWNKWSTNNTKQNI